MKVQNTERSNGCSESIEAHEIHSDIALVLDA